MRYSFRLALALEVFTLITALAAPSLFVELSARVLSIVTNSEKTTVAYAYGVVLVMVTCSFSLARKARKKFAVSSFNKAAAFVSLFVTAVGLLIFYQLVSSNIHSVGVHTVVTPYLSYAMSVFFCIGLGYAIADLLSIFIRRK
jgi:hypothetical protein